MGFLLLIAVADEDEAVHSVQGCLPLDFLTGSH